MFSEREEYLSREQAAKEAGVVACTIDRWLKLPDGPPSQKFRRRVQIPRAGFMKWLQSQVEPRRAQQ